MNHEIGPLWQSVDLVNRDLQRRGDIRVRRLIKTDVAVADLDEAEIAAHRILLRTFGEHARDWDPSAQGPNQAGSRPRHTLQKPAAVDSIIVEILQPLIDEVMFLVCHFSSVLLPSELITGWASRYSKQSQGQRTANEKGGLRRGRLFGMGLVKKRTSPAAQSLAGMRRLQSRAVDCGWLTHGLSDLSELTAVSVRVRKGK